MRFPDLKLPIAILASLLILHGCAQRHRLIEQDRSKLGTVGIVRAAYAPELGLDAYAVGGGAGGTKGAFQALGSCLISGPYDPIMWAIAVTLICPPFTIYGAYYGTQKAVPEEEALMIENLAKRQAETIRFQDKLLEQVSKYLGETDYPFRVIEKGGPTKPDESPDYRWLKREGIDAVLEVGLRKIILKGDGTDPDLSLQTWAVWRLVLTEDNREIHAYPLPSRPLTQSKAQKYKKWAENDHQLLKDELTSAFDDLGEIIVTSTFLCSDTTLCPASPFDKPVHYRDSLKTEGTIKTFFKGKIVVDSLQPTLAWEPIPVFAWWVQNPPDTRKSISQISYYFALWKIDEKSQALIYERKNLTESRHRIEEPLEPSTMYAWTVRARFVLDGRTRLTRWACRPEDRRNYYHFQTPERVK